MKKPLRRRNVSQQSQFPVLSDCLKQLDNVSFLLVFSCSGPGKICDQSTWKAQVFCEARLQGRLSDAKGEESNYVT